MLVRPAAFFFFFFKKKGHVHTQFGIDDLPEFVIPRTMDGDALACTLIGAHVHPPRL